MNTNSNSDGIKSSTKFALKSIPPSSVLPPVDNVAELLTKANKDGPVEIVKGLIHQGTKVVLGGSSKVGKTWLLIYLALCVAFGKMFIRWPTKQGRVLYLNFEILAPFMIERLQTMVNHLKLDSPTNLDLWNLRGKVADFDSTAHQIIKKAEQGDYAMIILDPIYKVMGGKSENMAGGVGALCHQLERIAARTGAAVVYAHHFTKGKQTQKKSIDRLSGSGVFGRDADSVILFTDHSEAANCFTVDLILRNLPPQPSFVVEWKYPVMVENDDLEPESDDGLDNERIRKLLSLLLDNPLTTGEWEVQAKQEGISRATFFRMKKDHKEKGYVIQNLIDKTWSLAPGMVEPVDTGETNETRETTAPVKALGWNGGVVDAEVVA